MSKDTSIVLKREVTPIVTEAMEISVSDKKGLVLASEYLSKLNKVADKIEEEKQKVLTPLNAARKAELNRWRPIEEMYEGAIDHLRLSIGDYQTSEVKRQREEEKRIADRIGAGRGKIGMDTAMRKLDNVEKAETIVSTAVGSVKFRETKVLVVKDIQAVPREYMIVNENKVLESLKAGVSVAGCELEIKMIPVNSR